MTHAYIYDAVRTPRGKGRKGGGLHGATPAHLAATVLAALRDRHALDTSAIDDVVLGCVEAVGEQGANIARIAALVAGYDTAAPGVQVNRFCASGLEACNLAAAQVMAGQADLVVGGGGVESMSRVPMMTSGGAWAMDPDVARRTYFVPQGVSADIIATRWGYSRHALDSYAVESQRRATRAQEEGRYAASLVMVRDVNGFPLLDRDECVRPDTSLESLSTLPPAFAGQGELGFDAIALQRYPDMERIEHRHHAGNSSGIVDGAAALLIGSREAGRRMGLRPRARICAFGSIGSEPTLMLTGPSLATEKVLSRAGMGVRDVDLFEVNEAFAAVVLRFLDALAVPADRVNVNGGAIALGHPLGATGAMLLGTVLDELERRDLSTGLVTLCVGAGMGTATLIERV